MDRGLIQSLIRYLHGYVRVRVEGDSPERFLNMCSYHGIYIWGLRLCGHAYEMYMNLDGFRRIRPIVRKTHTGIRITGRYGFPFFLHRHRKRKLFFLGMLLCLCLLWGYSLFIWDIHFDGNDKWTDETLSEFLAAKDVKPAMLKSNVDCAQIVKDIRAEYDDIVWVSASLDGSRLRIQIKENEDTFREEETENEAKEDAAAEGGEAPKDLIASADGVITDIITRSGTPMVHVGDSVKKGDLLVSGRVEIKNDAQEVTGYQYQHSDADVMADTTIEYEDSMPRTYQEKIYREKEIRFQGYVRIGAYTFSVGGVNTDSGKWERYTQEYQVKLGENFRLPVSIGFSYAKSYDTETKKYTEEEIREQLSKNFSDFSEELEERGIQIQENSVKIHLYANSAKADGTLYLNQSIAEEADTEILDLKGTDTDESIGTDD